MSIAGKGAWLVADGGEMHCAMPRPVDDARHEMLAAVNAPTRRARSDFVPGENGVRFVGTSRSIGLADQASRPIGASEVFRAMDLSVHRAPGLMPLAHDSLAASAVRYLVGPDDLAGTALARPRACMAKPS